MVMRTYFKASIRMFKKHFTKFISISFIILISIGLIFGVVASPSKVNDSVTKYYLDSNVSDLLVKSTKLTGFTKVEIDKIKDMYGSDNVMVSSSFDIENSGEVTRYHYLDLDNININKLELIEGEYPKDDTEVLVERSTSFLKEYEVGDTILYNNIVYTISGIVINPYYFQKLEESSFLEDKDLTTIVYLNINDYIPINDIYLSLKDKADLNNMDDSYKKIINKEKRNIDSNLDDITILSLYENISFYKLFTVTEKINVIALVLLVGFICVSGLVVLSTMSRLTYEEMHEIGCLETLGYSNHLINLRYILFAFFSTLIGGLFAYLVGVFLTSVIYYNFEAIFDMPLMIKRVESTYYFVNLFILIVSTLGVTIYTSYKITSVLPAYVFKKKAPRKGKKTIIEHIPIIWNHLSFKYKSSLRNLLRYKKHFFMTVISIMGSTILVFLGIGLFSYSLHDELLGDALAFICGLILIFAALLTILVIYTLTNINISERYKEIATLMVLGYYNREVTGYIYREIYIMCFIGMIIGLPLGHISLEGLFQLLDFGNMSEVSVYVYLITPLMIMIFTIAISLILRRKIVSIKFSEALKEVE